ncbi:MAG: MFS transporter [Sphingobium sp.]|nr:MFS transporter [Sphingobium sp.]
MQSPANRWLILTALILAFFPIVIDMTILHIAVPSLTMALKAGSTEILWIIDIYPLMMAGLLVPMGTLADRIGHRPLMLTGLCIFTLASAMAAFAPTPALLITARAILAVGASMIIPSILALIRLSFTDDKERAFALGLWSTVASGGAAIGPLAGGVLLEHFWWGSVFLINIPIMLIVLPICWRLLPYRPARPLGNWNIGQALLLIAGLITTVYAVKSGLSPTGQPTQALALLAGGIMLLLLFARLQLRSAEPMLDLTLFSRPVFTIGLIMALVASGAMAGFELLLAQELQYIMGKTPLQAGLFMVPLALASAAAGPLAGLLTGRFGLRAVATTGMAVSASSLFLLSRADLNNIWETSVLLVAFGLSLGCGLLASSVAIMGSAPPEKAGAAGSLEATGYELGAGLGISFFGILLSTIYHRAFVDGAQASELAYTEPYSPAFHSIGEAMIISRDIGGEQGTAIAALARASFASAHSAVLTSSALLIGALAVLVFIGLKGFRSNSGQ